MTFYDIYQEILEELNITAGQYERITEDMVVNAINEAQKSLLDLIELSNRADYLLAMMSKIQDLTITGNSAPVPSDFGKPLSLWRKDGFGSVHTARMATRAYVNSVMDNAFEKPTLYNPYFVIEGDTIYIYPNPLTDDTISLYYIPMPTEWSGTSDTTSVPDYPDIVHPAIKYYACYILAKSNESGLEEKAQLYYQNALLTFGVSNVK